MPTEDHIFKVAQARFREAENDKAHMQRRWRISEAYLIGEHNVRWDRLNKDLTRVVTEPDWKPRVIINFCYEYYRKELGRLVSSHPQFEAAPATRDLDDLVSADLATKLMHHWDRTLKTKLLAAEVSASGLIYGIGFLKPRWDPDAQDELGRPVGDIALDCLSAWEVNAWPKTSQPTCMFHTTERPYEYVKDTFPWAADKIKPGGGDTPKRSVFQRIGTALRPGGSGQSVGTDPPVTLTEYWETPSQRQPGGVWMIWCGDILLHGPVPIPYNHHKIPIIPFRYVAVPGLFWGLDFLYNLSMLNSVYNRTRSQDIDLVNRVMGGDKILNPSGTGLNQKDFDSGPGRVLTFNPVPDAQGHMQKPEVFHMPQPPAGIFGRCAQLREEMDNIASQHEPSRGVSAGGSESAAGVRSLQEADVVPLGPTSLETEERWREVYNQMLSLGQQFYQEPRLIRWFGHTGQLEVMSQFSARDIQPNVDIVVRSGSGLPVSRTERRQDVQNLVLAQIVSPIEGRSMLEASELMPMDHDTRLEVAYVEEENFDLDQGVVRFVQDIDNHMVHMQGHARHAKQPGFRRLPPQIQRLHQMHRAGHQQVIQASQQQAQMAQQSA